MRHFNWRYASMFAVATLAFEATQKADAAAFQLRENTTLGAARAGSGATGGDLTTMAINPAIMSTIDKSAAAALATVVAPSFRFKSDGATQQTGAALGVPNQRSIANLGNGGNAGSVVVVPAGYLMWHVNDHLNLGLGITVPFGLTTKYDPKWIGRYHAVKSKLTTTDINPAFSYKVNKFFSFGGGISVQFAKAELTRAAWNVANGGAVVTPDQDFKSSLEGTSIGYGFNGGILISPWEHTRFGLSYRSAVQHVVKGNASLQGSSVPGADQFRFVRPVKASMTLPEIVTFSAHHDINKNWAVMADVEWTRWSRLKSLDVYNQGSTVRVTGKPVVNGGLMSSETFDYKNSWFYSLGLRWKYSDNLLFKFGVAYDMTPTKDEHRSPRVPDEARIWFTTGLEHDFNDHAKITLDYAYIHFKDASINKTRVTSFGAGNVPVTETLNGKFESNSHLLGVKFQYKF